MLTEKLVRLQDGNVHRTTEYRSLNLDQKPGLELRTAEGGFLGGTVVKNPPANAGDTGSSPGAGGSHMPRSDWSRAPQLLSLRSGAYEPQLLSLHATTAEARVPQLLKPTCLEPVLCNGRGHPMRSLRTVAKSGPHSPQLEGARMQQ